MLPWCKNPPLKRGRDEDKMVCGFSTLLVIAYGVNSRACIIRKKEIKMIPVAHISNKDLAVGLWTTPSNDKFVVCSAYFPQDEAISKSIQELEKVREYAGTKGYGLIIMGDFNAHGQLWGSKENNTRGTLLEKYLLESDLALHNTGCATWKNWRYATHIDLTLSNDKLKGRLRKVEGGL